jgi:hypothetical protein
MLLLKVFSIRLRLNLSGKKLLELARKQCRLSLNILKFTIIAKGLIQRLVT